MNLKRNLTYDPYTREKVNMYRVPCKCGHTLTFISNHSQICGFCGKKVYPSDICEFREKMNLEMRKMKYE